VRRALGEAAERWRRGAVSIAKAADSGVGAESPHPDCGYPQIRPSAATCHPWPLGYRSIRDASGGRCARTGLGEEADEKSTEPSGHAQQVRDNPLECASAPSPACCTASLACQSLTCVHAPQPSFSLRPFKLPTGVQDVLLERVRRILASDDESFAPSPPPALLDAITDELLVVASGPRRRLRRLKRRSGS